MKIATIGLVAAICAGSAGSALAGANVGGYLLLHTDDSVIYTSDDEATYSSFLDAECPIDPECDDNHVPCVDFLFNNVNPTSGRDGTAGEVSMIWLLAAFELDACPRVSGVQFGLSWELEAQPNFKAYGNCGDFELPTAGWPAELNAGVAVTWSSARKRHGLPIYWFAAYEYYMPTTISVAEFPNAPGAAFADDQIPSQLDHVDAGHRGSVGLNGAIGDNPYPDPVNPTLEMGWGEVKAIFGR